MSEPPFVSTGSLPPAPEVRALVEEAWARFLPDTSGTLSTVYPALTAADPDRFGVAVVSAAGATAVAGDAHQLIPVMSVMKPFTFALLCEATGPAAARRTVGVNATGLPFNSVTAVEASPDGRTNPMVNAGALVTVALLPGDTASQRWDGTLRGLSAFAGRELSVDETVLASALATNARNRALAVLLHSLGVLPGDPSEAVGLYTRACCLSVSAVDLAVMGATLANGGVNPVSRRRVVSPLTCRAVLSVMATAGLYETSGDWLYETGLPGKSGISGGMVTVSPGKGALGTCSPRLDPAGNSVRGQQAARFLSGALGLDLFASTPVP